MTPARRKRIIAKSDGHCAYPCCLESSGLEIDHTIPLELAGKDEDENLVALCRAHHAAKTRLDIKMIAKARRLRVKNDPDQRKPPKMKSAGFKPKPPGFKTKWPKRKFGA